MDANANSQIARHYADSRARLDSAKTISDMQKVSAEEILNNGHVIIGDGGRCLCGSYEDGVLFCSDFLKRAAVRFTMGLSEQQTKELLK